jgi:hypothetical protein
MKLAQYDLQYKVSPDSSEIEDVMLTVSPMLPQAANLMWLT